MSQCFLCDEEATLDCTQCGDVRWRALLIILSTWSITNIFSFCSDSHRKVSVDSSQFIPDSKSIGDMKWEAKLLVIEVGNFSNKKKGGSTSKNIWINLDFIESTVSLPQLHVSEDGSCLPYCVVSTLEAGKAVLATRDIQPGQLIFR